VGVPPRVVTDRNPRGGFSGETSIPLISSALTPLIGSRCFWRLARDLPFKGRDLSWLLACIRVARCKYVGHRCDGLLAIRAQRVQNGPVLPVKDVCR
jgi:hypothetical protein